MKFLSYLTERKAAPISSDQLQRYLTRLFREKVFTKDRWEKYYKDSYQENVTFKQWQDMEIDINVRFEDWGDHVELRSRSVRDLTGIEKGYYGYAYEDWKEIAEIVDRYLKKVGWFVSDIGKNLSIGRLLVLEPFYGDRVNPPKYVYHFSVVMNKLSILKRGIIPSSSDRLDYRYPHRVFVLTKYNKADVRELAQAVHTYGADIEDMYYGKVGLVPIVVFRIDTGKLRRGTKFYKDPAVQGGLWTYSPIPPQALTVIYEDENEA